jgi:16S rRNA processing protein RimM
VPEEKVAIALINKSWGVKGEVVAQPLTRFTQRFKQLGKVNISGPRIDLDLTVEAVRPHSGRVLIKFKEISDREEAARLRNTYLQIDASETFELPEGNYYHFQLVGLEVFDAGAEKIGKISDVWEYPAGDIIVVKSDKGRMLIPFISEIIKNIDIENDRMEVVLLPGMEFEAE